MARFGLVGQQLALAKDYLKKLASASPRESEDDVQDRVLEEWRRALESQKMPDMLIVNTSATPFLGMECTPNVISDTRQRSRTSAASSQPLVLQ